MPMRASPHKGGQTPGISAHDPRLPERKDRLYHHKIRLRFARNTVECLEYIRSLKAQGIGIFFEEQNIDTLKSDSELYLVIYAGFAQSESESISKHITWTYRKNFEDGKVSFQYKRLLGYRKGEDGKPEIVPEEAAIVERIFEMLLAGQPVGLIAQTLQSENIEIPGKDLSFSKNMIMNILRNEKYCGDSILQKTVTVDCISKTRKANHGEAPDVPCREQPPGDHQPRHFPPHTGRTGAAKGPPTKIG